VKSTESQAEIQQQAQEIWDGAAAAPDQHPFFACWGVSVNGLKIYRGDLSIDGVRCDGMLLVPMRDAERNLQNLAFLGLTERHYLSNDHVLNSYFGFGQRSDRILVAKGFLQGARAHRAFGHAVAVAFTAENVPNVMQIMRKRYTDARIVLVAPDGSIQSADLDAHAADASGDESAAAPGFAGEDAADERSDAPQAATEPQEGPSQAPPPSRTSDANALLKPESEEAQLLLNWIQRKKLTELTRKQTMQYGPNSLRYAPLAKLALGALVRSGWLATEDESRYLLTPTACVALGVHQSEADRVARVVAE
jgi:phage/plasmid primase-like uncharacterized protein